MLLQQREIYDALKTNFQIGSYSDYASLANEVQYDIRDFVVRKLWIDHDPENLWSVYGGRESLSFSVDPVQVEQIVQSAAHEQLLLSNIGVYSERSSIQIGHIQVRDREIIELPSHGMIKSLYRFKQLIETSMAVVSPEAIEFRGDDHDYDPLDAWSMSESEEIELRELQARGVPLPQFIDSDTNRLHFDVPLLRERGILEPKGLVTLNLRNTELRRLLGQPARSSGVRRPIGMAIFKKPWRKEVTVRRCVDFRLEYESEYGRFQRAFRQLFDKMQAIDSESALAQTLEQVNHEVRELEHRYKLFERKRARDGSAAVLGLAITLGVVLFAPPAAQGDLRNLLGGLSAFKGIEFITADKIPDEIMASPFWFPWYLNYR